MFSFENNERPVWWDLIAMVIMWFQSSSVGQRAPLGAESASFPRWIINEQQQHPQSSESLRNNTKRIIFQPGFFRLSIPELLFCHYQADEIHDALVIEDLVDSGHFKNFSCISSFCSSVSKCLFWHFPVRFCDLRHERFVEGKRRRGLSQIHTGDSRSGKADPFWWKNA